METVKKFYMYDIARGAYLRPEAFHKILKQAAASGFTHFIPYLENMIDLPSMTKASCRCAYTEDDWKAFQKTAKECGIELVPHFNVIGHSNQICLVYPELTCGGISAEKRERSEEYETLADPSNFAELNPGAPEARQWMLRCLNEFCNFSESQYFLIGGDEWNTPPSLLAQKDFDAGIAWCDYMNIAIDYLVSRNRIPIIWHDMLVHYPHILERLNKNAVIAFWFYDYDSGYPFLDILKKYGFKTIMATGLCNGAMSLRRFNAFNRAMEECKKYQADGFMVTTWMDGRFERQFANLALCGELLSGKEISSVYPETLSAVTIYRKTADYVGEGERLAQKQRLEQLLSDPVWERFPDYRDLLRNTIEDRKEELRKVYEINHYPEGPFYETFNPRPKTAAAPAKKTVPADIPSGFGVDLTQDPVTGNTIRLYNEGETFVLYPDYGARLQDWRFGEHKLIANGLPAFLKKNPHQKHGSFRSFNSPGFMPMWDFGTHLNPNIIWQYAWDFKIDTSVADEISVEMFRKFPQAEIKYNVSIKKGVHGFRWDLKAVNLLPDVTASFGWNFCLSTDRTFTMKFQGKKLLDFRNDLPILNKCSALQVEDENFVLNVETPEEYAEGFWIDWGPGWITPDFHGKYRTLSVGETYETSWNLSLVPHS
ncbi:MAG: family 20 glycosylhydrolase [Lentisphaeria bacterium]|nr:family 20 glycosylhydrolase [Lentisphaeria bacterium]